MTELDRSRSAHEMARRLGRGVSLGNCLDVGGDVSPWLRGRHLELIAEAGFDTIRLPVRWSAHAGETDPYVVDPRLFRRVGAVVDEALRLGLNVVVNVHHYDALYEACREHGDRFLALWRQIAQHYAAAPPEVYFELLNEPRNPMGAQDWNALLKRTLPIVRESNPDRAVLVGPAEMNDLHALPALRLPPDDRLIVTIHYYAPFPFTHQGAPWWPGAAAWIGTTWGSDADRTAVRTDLATAAGWAAEHHCPMFLGEFGCFEAADMSSRARWTAAVRAEAERLGMSWAYWDFGTDFGVYDLETDGWHPALRQALMAKTKERDG